jgi:small-conductance mechanosensitive channel
MRSSLINKRSGLRAMGEAKPHAWTSRGYWHVIVEFVVALIVLSTIGAILSVDRVALGFTVFYALIARLILLALGAFTVLTLIHVPLRREAENHGGAHLASIVSFFGTLIVLVVGFLTFLTLLKIPPSTLLVAVGGIGIVVGFAVSTITTNVISGAFMLTSYPIKIGQRIIITVNNQPGTITSVSTLFMTVTTDAGARLVIPNSAIFQGMAFMLDIGSNAGDEIEDRHALLLAKPGDKVISTVYPYPGTVTEATPLVTRVTTDSGQVLTIPNQAILNGSSALVKIQQQQHRTAGGEQQGATAPPSNLPIAVGDEVRLSAGDFRGKVTEIGTYYFRVSGIEEDVVIPTSSITNGGVIIFKKKGQPTNATSTTTSAAAAGPTATAGSTTSTASPLDKNDASGNNNGGGGTKAVPPGPSNPTRP